MKVKVNGKLKEYTDIKRKPGIVIPAVQEHLLALGNVDVRPSGVVHPSDMCKPEWCERADYYRISTGVDKKSEERFNFILQNIFAEGDFIHEKWQGWLADTGKLWGDWMCPWCKYVSHERLQFELPDNCPACRELTPWKYAEVSLKDGLISGHEDGALLDERILIEIKSIGIGTIRKDNPALMKKFYVEKPDGGMMYDLDGLWKSLKRPFLSHLKQAQVYLFMAQQMGLPFDQVSIVYEYKFNQQPKEFTVKLNMSVIRPLLDRVDLISRGLEDGIPPPCPYGGCKQCSVYEESDEGTTVKERDVPARRVRRRYTSRSGEAGDRTASEAAGRDASHAKRHHRLGRQRPDEAVPANRGMEQVPGDTASAGRGRRKVRR